MNWNTAFDPGPLVAVGAAAERTEVGLPTISARLRAGPWAGCHVVLGNRRGAAAQIRAEWGKMESKYDALLAVNLDPAGPADRRVVLSALQLEMQVGAETFPLDAAAVQSVRADSARSASWLLELHGVRLMLKVQLGVGNALRLQLILLTAVSKDMCFYLRPELEDRSFHAVTQAFKGVETAFPAGLRTSEKGFQFALDGGHELAVACSGKFELNPKWRYCVQLPLDAARGLEMQTDVFCPGQFCWSPTTESVCEFSAIVDGDELPEMEQHSEAGTLPLQTQMEQALDLYLADREGQLTVIAGYPWFLDWGRDSLVFARGLIAAGRIEEAGQIIARFASYEQQGTLPNMLRGATVASRKTSDAPLWLCLAAWEWVAAGGSWGYQCGGRSLGQVVTSIGKHLRDGAANGVHMDAESALLWSPAHYTWMDTDAPACTPREGYPIEIQALWITASQTLARLESGSDWLNIAQRATAHLNALYWREEEGFFSDCLHAVRGVQATAAVADDHLRPNQWWAMALGTITDTARLHCAIEVSECLLIPGAARSLAPRPVKYALPITWEGQLLNDPYQPYQPRYSGPEQTKRKPAYHNGTAWPWMMPVYAEALMKSGIDHAHAKAMNCLASSSSLLAQGCLGHLPEVLDAEPPHVLRGCGAQAWSVSEWVRVWNQIYHHKKKMQLRPS
jgi:predicted glycogen debranching enzyme